MHTYFTHTHTYIHTLHTRISAFMYTNITHIRTHILIHILTKTGQDSASIALGCFSSETFALSSCGVTERDFKTISLDLHSCWVAEKSVDCARFEADLMNKFTKLLSGYQPTFRELTVISKGLQKVCF